MNKRIQFRLFDEVVETGQPAVEPASEPAENKEPNGKTFTREELAKMLSAEKTKLEEGYTERVNQAVQEALRQAQLSDEDKRAEADKKAEAERIAKEKDLNRRELLIEAKELLVEKNLNKEFINVLNFENQETMLQSINDLSEFITKEINTGIENGVKERLANSSLNPKAQEGAKKATSNKNSIKKFAEQKRIIK